MRRGLPQLACETLVEWGASALALRALELRTPREFVTARARLALSCVGMVGRRFLALVLAVLCIVGWARVQAAESHADELVVLAATGVVGRTATDPRVQPEGPTLTDALVGRSDPTLPAVRSIVGGSGEASDGVAPAPGRKGVPGAPRGPPLLVMS